MRNSSTGGDFQVQAAHQFSGLGCNLACFEHQVPATLAGREEGHFPAGFFLFSVQSWRWCIWLPSFPCSTATLFPATSYLQHSLEGPLEKCLHLEENHKERCHENSGKQLAKSVLVHILVKAILRGLLITTQFYWNKTKYKKGLLNPLGKGTTSCKHWDNTCIWIESPSLNVFKSK